MMPPPSSRRWWAGGSVAVQIMRQPQRQPRPDIHQHHADDGDEHVGHHAGEDLVQRHGRWRDALQIEGGHATCGDRKAACRLTKTSTLLGIGSIPKCFSIGRKIGTKITMISVHSSGQPRMKMIACDRIMNWTGVRFSDSTQLMYESRK